MGKKKPALDPQVPTKHKVCCGFNAFFICLLGAAAIVLIVLGATVVASRVHVQDFVPTNCTVVDKRYDVRPADRPTCSCGKHCDGHFPCHQLLVNFTSAKNTSDSKSVMCYDETVLHWNSECSFTADPCSPHLSDNNLTIMIQMNKFKMGDDYPCYYNPDDPAEVVYRRHTEILHFLLWPGVALLLFAALTLATCYHCLQACRISADIRKARACGRQDRVGDVIRYHTDPTYSGSLREIFSSPGEDPSGRGWAGSGGYYNSGATTADNTGYTSPTTSYWQWEKDTNGGKY